MARGKVSGSVWLEEDSLLKLRAISANTHIPIAVLIREGIDMVLERTEKEQELLQRFRRYAGVADPD